MLEISTDIKYAVLTIVSTGKKSFKNMGHFIKKSGDTVSRLLQPKETSFEIMQRLCQSAFKDKRKLFCIIDDTLIKKWHSRFMQGSGWFFDTKIGRRIIAYRLVLGMISDGKCALPISCSYLFSKELVERMQGVVQSKEEITQKIICLAQRLFPTKKIVVLADGLYATVTFLEWCHTHNVSSEVRMHSNRVVCFKGKKHKLKDLLIKKGICPKGRQMARTISVLWHNIPLEISIVRRIDKKGEESIVFQAATHKALPREHVASYKKRWPIEKAFRTTKQLLGLSECFSTSLEKQYNHVASVFLAYTLAQLEMKKRKLRTPEQAIRRFETQNVHLLNIRFASLDKIFRGAYA